MADMGEERRSTARTVADRLWNSRWLLAAGIVAIVTVYVFAGMSAYVLLLALAMLFGAVMLPTGIGRQSAERAAAIEASQAPGLADALSFSRGSSRLDGSIDIKLVFGPRVISIRVATRL